MSNQILSNGDEEFEQEVSLSQTFSFPEVLTEHEAFDAHLIIAPEYANWLVCDDNEYKAFQLLQQKKSVEEVEVLLGQTMPDAMDVISRLLAQILGKEFLREAKVSDKEVFRSASLGITLGCNLRCTHCLRNATLPKSNECSFKQWMKFIRAFRDFGGRRITLTGGEPMIKTECFQIIEEAKRIGFEVVLLTNGTLITEENARILGENCAEIRVSIDGPNAETHDSIRGRGMFERAIAALRYLSAYPRCRLSIAMTPTPATFPAFKAGLRRFVDWLWKNVNPNITLRITRRVTEGRNLPRMSRSDELAFQGDIVALCGDQLREDCVHKADAFEIVPNQRIFGCGLAEKFLIKENGDFELCDLRPNYPVNIKDIEDGESFFRDLTKNLGELICSTRVEKLQPCSDCDLRYFCGGKCRKDNVDDSGDPNICSCDTTYREDWYKRLVRIEPYILEPLTDRTERR